MKLGIVIPCYNEEEVFGETTRLLGELFESMIESGAIDKESFICYVDDGSKDKTWELIEQASEEFAHFKGIKLSRNFGQQNALIAGLMQLKNSADALISMDADLQDDIMLIKEFVQKYKEGYDVVYGVREDRSKDSSFKRNTAELFYKVQDFMGIENISNHAHYRLLSQKALNALAQFKEIDMYLRGVIPLIGFRSCSIYYTRDERFAGDTKYSVKALFLLAIDGIASFSVMPLRFITGIGFLLFIFSLFMIVWILFEKIVLNSTVDGWASMMTSIYFIGGIQVMSIGIIGEYIGRIFQEVKERPRYFIDKEI
ncbi:MAG TPA: glycosyltransferase [Campylobacterales bacterium]|nr:glycosyltransferase [Campylobacterales bacterium]